MLSALRNNVYGWLAVGLIVIGAMLGGVELVAQEFPSIPRSVANELGQVMPYRIILPRDYDPSRAYPLFLFLHSGGEVGDDNISQINHGTGQVIIARSQAQAGGSIFVAPQTTFGFSGDRANELLHRVIDDVENSYLVDTRRRYVTGYSLGGIGTWDLIARDPEFFAAAVPIAGAGTPSWGARLTQMPIWAFHGELDDVISVEGSRSMIEAIRAAGGTPRYTEYMGGSHDAWTPTFGDKGNEVFDWMFQQVRPVPEPNLAATLILLAIARHRSFRSHR